MSGIQTWINMEKFAVGYVLLPLDDKKAVIIYTHHEKCADMINLLIIEP